MGWGEVLGGLEAGTQITEETRESCMMMLRRSPLWTGFSEALSHKNGTYSLPDWSLRFPVYHTRSVGTKTEVFAL